MTDFCLSLLFGPVVAADNVGGVGILFFLLLDEGAVVVIEGFVYLDFFAFDLRLAGHGLLGARRFGVGLFERYGLDLGRLRHSDLFNRRRTRDNCRGFWPPSGHDRRD